MAKTKKFESKKVAQNTVVKEVTKEPASNKRKVKWVLTLVMSIIFGYLGVDRFIMGHVGLGLLKIVTFGGCGIWWLIDVILIASKNEFKDIEWVD